MPVDEEGQIEIRDLRGNKAKKPIEEIMIMASNLLIVGVLVIMIVRLIAQQEIRKADPTKRQRDKFYDIASSAFDLHEWRVRQIAQAEAWRAIDDWRAKQQDAEQIAEEVSPDIDPVKHRK